MTHDCACTRPIHDTAVVCPHCGFLLDAALAEITRYRGLAFELDITLSRQAHTATGNSTPKPQEPQAKAPGTLRPTPAPSHGGASKAAAELKTALVTWAQVVHSEAGAVLPGDDTIAGVARWLRPHVGWLRYHEAGQEAVDGICDAVAAGWRAVDRPADTLYAGPCDCGVDLYARLDASYVTCRSEVHEDGPLAWPVEERRRWLLKSAEDVLATTSEISRALTRYQQPVTPAAVDGYVRRGRLVRRGERLEPGRRKPVALYRLGDVLDILAKQAEKASA